MHVVDLLALSLAIGGLVDCWFNGSIFERKREKLKHWTIFSCDYCMNWQAPIWLIVLFYVPSLWLPHPWDTTVKLPIYWLAAAYVAWLINEYRGYYSFDYARTVRDKENLERYGRTSRSDATPIVVPDPKEAIPVWLPASYPVYVCSDDCKENLMQTHEDNDEPCENCQVCHDPIYHGKDYR